MLAAHQFEKLRALQAAARVNEDAKAVHEMRVACRRMNSALRLQRAALLKRAKKLAPTLKELRDALGAARNLDVLRADLAEYCAVAPPQDRVALEQLDAAWSGERARLQEALLALLDSARFEKWCARVQAFTQELDARSNVRIADVIPALIWKQYGVVRAHETQLDHLSWSGYHALRIETKRLRYTLEFFRELLDGETAETKTLLEPLITIQDGLGKLQDAVVAGYAITDFVSRQAKRAEKEDVVASDFRALAAYHAYLNARRAALRGAFPISFAVVVQPGYRETLGRLTARL